MRRFEIMNKEGFQTDGSTASTRPENLEVRHKGHVDWIYFMNKSQLPIQFVPFVPIGDERASDHKLTMADIDYKTEF